MDYKNGVDPLEELLRKDFIENDEAFTSVENQNNQYDEEERPQYEPSHDTKEYKEWEFKERLFSDWDKLQKELVEIKNKQ